MSDDYHMLMNELRARSGGASDGELLLRAAQALAALLAERDRAWDDAAEEAHARVGFDYNTSIVLISREKIRADDAEAKLEALRVARGNHPECDVHPGEDVVTCGWKRAVLDMDAVLNRD